MTELEIRFQASYNHVASTLTRTIDEVANLRGELAVKMARIAELEAELQAAKQPEGG